MFVFSVDVFFSDVAFHVQVESLFASTLFLRHFGLIGWKHGYRRSDRIWIPGFYSNKANHTEISFVIVLIGARAGAFLMPWKQHHLTSLVRI